MKADRMTLSMIIAQAQALQIILESVTRGDCADCQCDACVSLRGMAQVVKS